MKQTIHHFEDILLRCKSSILSKVVYLGINDKYHDIDNCVKSATDFSFGDEIYTTNMKTKLKINLFKSHEVAAQKISFGGVVEIQSLEKQAFLLGCTTQKYQNDFCKSA
jgi:hypothetical protein